MKGCQRKRDDSHSVDDQSIANNCNPNPTRKTHPFDTKDSDASTREGLPWHEGPYKYKLAERAHDTLVTLNTGECGLRSP